MLLPSAPPDCFTFLVPDGSFAPHLRDGELAVICPSDCEPEHGELFLIAHHDARRESGLSFGLCQLRRTDGWFSDRLRGFCSPQIDPDGRACGMWHVRRQIEPDAISEEAGGSSERRLIEGPYRAEGLAGQLVGRVVGVFSLEAGR